MLRRKRTYLAVTVLMLLTALLFSVCPGMAEEVAFARERKIPIRLFPKEAEK